MSRSMRRTWFAACVLSAAAGGCVEPRARQAAATPHEVPRVELAFHLVTMASEEGARKVVDEHGETMHIEAEPLLTEKDVIGADVLAGERRYLVRVEFSWYAADRIESATRENLGRRLAILIDGDVVVSPFVQSPITGGKAVIDGGFSRSRAEEIARGLNAGRTR